MSPTATRRLPTWGGMVKRPVVTPWPVLAVPLNSVEPQCGTGRFQSSTPLKASRATSRHWLGTLSSTQGSDSSQMANSRPRADTIALTLGV